MHVEHRQERFQVISTRIENNSFTHKSKIRLGLFLVRSVAQPDDPCAVIFIALGDGEKCAGAELRQCLGVEALVIPVAALQPVS